jgi:hypothetical protein
MRGMTITWGELWMGGPQPFESYRQRPQISGRVFESSSDNITVIFHIALVVVKNNSAACFTQQVYSDKQRKC